MDNGNLGVNLLYVYAGNPTGVSTAAFNPPVGSLVVDTSTPALWQKTSILDNSTFSGGAGSTFTAPLITGGLTASGSASNDFSGSTGTFKTSSGTTIITGALDYVTSALSGAGAVNVTTTTTKLTTTGGSQALTLANGADGQIKTIIHDVDGGSAILTPTTKTGFSTLTFTNAGDTATLQYVTTRGWVILALNGTTAA